MRLTEKRQALVAAVRAHALANYDKGGWDVIVECWDDQQIAEQIGRARTLKGALAKFDTLIDVWSDRQAAAASEILAAVGHQYAGMTFDRKDPGTGYGAPDERIETLLPDGREAGLTRTGESWGWFIRGIGALDADGRGFSTPEAAAKDLHSASSEHYLWYVLDFVREFRAACRCGATWTRDTEREARYAVNCHVAEKGGISKVDCRYYPDGELSSATRTWSGKVGYAVIDIDGYSDLESYEPGWHGVTIRSENFCHHDQALADATGACWTSDCRRPDCTPF